MDATVSWTFLGVVSALLAALVMLASVLRARALAAAKESQTLAGNEALVNGTVMFADGENVALCMEIEERGVEQTSKNPRTVWREVARTTRFKAFYVERPGGMRVRVEPSKTTILADQLDRITWLGYGHRKRAAELSEGEAVWVHGALGKCRDPEAAAAGYRDAGGAGAVLRASKRAPLTVATHPLEHEFQQRAGTHGTFALLALIALASFGAAVVAPTVARARGTHESGIVEHVARRTSKGRTAGYDVRCRVGDVVVEDRLPEAPAIGSSVPVRIGVFSSQIGDEATVNAFWFFPALGVLSLLGALYRSRLTQLEPWYRKTLLVTSEPGPMREPPDL